MSIEQKIDQHKHEKKNVIVDVGLKNSRQLFNEHDPAPFRDLNLDPQFLINLVSAVEEFPPRTKMKKRILTSGIEHLIPENSLAIRDAVGTYFQYESTLAKTRLRKRYRTARYFSLIGLVTLIVCCTTTQFIEYCDIQLKPYFTTGGPFVSNGSTSIKSQYWV